MEENQKTKVCTKCGRELPIEMFSKGNGKYGKRSWCKECSCKATREYTKKKRLSSHPIPNPALAEFTPRQLMEELRARGYEGDLTFTEVKIHRIKL